MKYFVQLVRFLKKASLFIVLTNGLVKTSTSLSFLEENELVRVLLFY